MELERLSVALRQRNGWEALDLGIRLAIRHCRPLYASWLAVTLPIAVVLYLICQYWFENLVWLFLLLWWLKPAFDRIAVHVISHAVFGETPTVRDTLHALPRLMFSTRLLVGLTFGRITLTRAVGLPVDVLEGLRGASARKRKTLITRRVSGTAMCQTLLFLFVLEPVLWLGFLGLITMLIPAELMPDETTLYQLFSHPPQWFGMLLYATILAADIFLEPLYVAGGFMLYIKRRTDLEAWDVELQLRRIDKAQQARQASALARNFLGLLLCMTLSCGFLLTPVTGWATSTQQSRENAIARSGEQATQVLRDPRFGKEETIRSLHWRESKIKEPPKATAKFWQSILEFLEAIGNFFASLGRVGFWLLILTLTGGLMYVISRSGWLHSNTKYHVPPAELAGFDIRPQSLPDNVADAALKLLHQGDARSALSLLFRGSLSRLAHVDQVPFVRGDTEGDCLWRVHEHAPTHSGFVTHLLDCWQRLAYAHQSIDGSEVELLCRGWTREFDGGARA